MLLFTTIKFVQLKPVLMKLHYSIQIKKNTVKNVDKFLTLHFFLILFFSFSDRYYGEKLPDKV